MPAHLRALVTVLCAVVLGALLPAGAAHAASRTVQGGRLDWGIKSSFQSYVTGPIAKGSYSLTGGAATVGGSQFRFHSATGTYDGDTGAFRAGFLGGVHFVGHRKADGTHQLDLTISRPTVRISGGAGTLYVDVSSKAKDTGTVTTSSQVPFASLTLGGIDMRGGGNTVALNNLPARLTAEGARSFAGYYTAGTELDPVSLSADVRAAAVEQPPVATPTTKAPPASASKSPSPKATSGAIKDGAVDWGVRRTFREYVTGGIAKGKWTLSAGAQDGGALFRFPSGKGTYVDGRLTASFTGAVRFTGENGLDLALSGLRVAVAANGTGTLYADVDEPGLQGRRRPADHLHRRETGTQERPGRADRGAGETHRTRGEGLRRDVQGGHGDGPRLARRRPHRRRRTPRAARPGQRGHRGGPVRDTEASVDRRHTGGRHRERRECLRLRRHAAARGAGGRLPAADGRSPRVRRTQAPCPTGRRRTGPAADLNSLTPSAS